MAWPLEIAAASLLPTAISNVTLKGLMGSVFVSASAPAIYADLEILYLPGLRSAGIQAETAQLKGIGDSKSTVSQMAAGAIYGFVGEPFHEEGEHEEPPEPAAEPVSPLADRDRTRLMVSCGVAREASACGLAWEDPSGQSHVESLDDLRAHFSRIVRLIKIPHRFSRRKAVSAAVLRTTLFALAFPDRFVGDTEVDSAVRSGASRFLIDAAGSGRDPLSLRWRQAGERFAEDRPDAALGHLYDAILRSLDLPESIRGTLSSPAEALPTGMQVRELIYLARAGNTALKVLAASRLSCSQSTAAVLHTLEQLTWAADPLVRAAATRALARVIHAGHGDPTLPSSLRSACE